MCGTPSTCGSYKEAALGTGAREPQPFGTECGASFTYAPTAEPGDPLTGAASRAGSFVWPTGAGVLLALLIHHLA